MPLNRLPDYVSSNISLTGVSADYLDGIDSSVLSWSLRANRNISGGGTITFDSSSNLFWSNRFIIISNGRSPSISTDGYFDIYCPTSGTITGVGGLGNKTATAAGIQILPWEALYYVIPIGQSTVAGGVSNFRIASYGADVDIPHNWVLIAVRNGDDSRLYLNNGIILDAGQSQAGSVQSYLRVGTSNTENYIAFRGTTGDAPGDFNSGYIGERIYGGAEQSELLLFKGNDVDTSSGLDRIRLLAAGHRFDTYSTSLSGPFSTVGSAASVVRMTIDSTGVSLPRLNFSGGTSTITAQTLADGTISFDSTAGQLFSISNSLTGTIFAVNDISGLPSVEVTDLGIIKFNELYGQTVIGSGTPATNAMLSSIARTSATIPLVVRGAASQSANLQEWQNSTAATVASISNTGAITAVDLTLSGNLTVNGTTTNINTTNLVVEDKNIILADVASPSTTTADGGGITLLAGGSNKTFNWINATDRWTSSVGLEGSSIVRTGGTSAQFLKADGTVDSSTYLTTGTASSTYAPINNPTFTGNVTAPLFRVGSAPYYQYETQVGGGLDLGFKKLATITLPTGLYTGMSFYIEVIEVGGNFGNTSASTKSIYFVSAIRSGGVQDDAMSMSLTGPSTNRYLQGVKVDSATYEIQVRPPSAYNHLLVRAFGVSALNATVVFSNATVTGSTGIATYTPTSGNNNWFGNIKFWGTLSKDGGTSAQFLKADGSIDSSTYITGNQSITLSGDITGSGATAITTTLANSGATAGTYKSVTVDVKGRVTAGTNPTTLSGYGITDALDTSATAQTKSGAITASAFTTAGAVNINTAGLGQINLGDGNIQKQSGSGFIFNSSGSFSQGLIVTTGNGLALNYASPAITSNNASVASIFTSTVTGVTIGSSTIKSTSYPAAPIGTTSGTVTQSAQLSGYLGMPQNPYVAAGIWAYGIGSLDAGKHIYVTGTPTSATITIPANSAMAFEIGTTIVVMNDLGAATNISIAITTDTLQLAGTGATGTRTLARYGVASMTKVTSTKWIISGNGLT